MQSTGSSIGFNQNFETTIESSDGNVKWYFPRVQFTEIVREVDDIEITLRALTGETQVTVYNDPPVQVEAYITNLEQLDTLGVDDVKISKVDKGWKVTWTMDNPVSS